MNDEIFEYFGLTFCASKPVHVERKQLYKANLHLLYPGTTRRVMLRNKVNYVQCWAKTPEATRQKLHDTAIKELKRLEGTILSWIRENKWTEAPLDLYLFYRWDEMSTVFKWAKKRSAYKSLWDEILQPYFGPCRISEITEDTLVEIMDKITHRSQSKRRISPEEIMAWRLLEDICQGLVADELLEENPAKRQRSKARRSEQEALKRLSRRSFTVEECRQYARLCLQSMEEDSAYAASLLRLLLGMDEYEVCGLDLNAWQQHNNMTWLSIYQVFYQKRGHPAEMKKLIDLWAYRRLPCTPQVNTILARLVEQRLKDGGQSGDPIFVHKAVRLTPQRLKEVEKELLATFFQDVDDLPFRKGGRKRGNFARTDILRHTASYYFRKVCRVNPSECAVLLGITPPETYAEWYVDWNSIMVLWVLRQKLLRWHTSLLSEVQPTGYRNRFLRIRVREGGTLRITAPGGFIASWQKTG